MFCFPPTPPKDSWRRQCIACCSQEPHCQGKRLWTKLPCASVHHMYAFGLSKMLKGVGEHCSGAVEPRSPCVDEPR
eukprot:3438742-Pleurochrysis_carterae.AAC.6